MVCARQIIEELPNDLVRRNLAKYTAQYINRLMSLVDGWERSEQEKVKGLHPSYCDKTGEAPMGVNKCSTRRTKGKRRKLAVRTTILTISFLLFHVPLSLI